MASHLKSKDLALVYKALYSLAPLYLFGHCCSLSLVTLASSLFLQHTKCFCLGDFVLDSLSARKLLPQILIHGWIFYFL